MAARWKCRPGTRELRAADVAAIVKRGMFDFLHASGVVDEWAVDDEAHGQAGASGRATRAIPARAQPMPLFA